MELDIARMRGEALDAVVDVWRRSRWDAQPWLEERLGHSAEDDLTYFRDVVFTGYAVWIANGGGRPLGLMAIAGGEIDQLFVDPVFQGRGVGSALLARARALHPEGLGLYTHQRNARARAFYERHGFIAVRFGVSPSPESEPDVRYEWRPTGGRLAP